ncbi:hypothetical protein HanPSC8_Chr14g0596971 [Helianthus annuus]|nr:hypothetical protein HanPSC8_Chr14g0596971 [Helianthus annuus]
MLILYRCGHTVMEPIKTSIDHHDFTVEEVQLCYGGCGCVVVVVVHWWCCSEGSMVVL